MMRVNEHKTTDARLTQISEADITKALDALVEKARQRQCLVAGKISMPVGPRIIPEAKARARK